MYSTSARARERFVLYDLISVANTINHERAHKSSMISVDAIFAYA